MTPPRPYLLTVIGTGSPRYLLRGLGSVKPLSLVLWPFVEWPYYTTTSDCCCYFGFLSSYTSFLTVTVDFLTIPTVNGKSYTAVDNSLTQIWFCPFWHHLRPGWNYFRHNLAVNSIDTYNLVLLTYLKFDLTFFFAVFPKGLRFVF